MNPFFDVFETTDEFTPLSATHRVVLDCCITLDPEGGVVYFRGENSVEVPFYPGQFQSWDRLNLALVFVKSNSPQLLTIIGRST